MSKYKVGDKVVLTVTSTNEMGCLPCYVLNDDLILSKQDIDKYTEPLSTYTEPLEAKIRRQAAEITRLLAENKRLKAENGNVIWEIEQAFDRGCNAAWKLARKIVDDVDNGGYRIGDLVQIFGLGSYSACILCNTYSEAAAKVEAWERQKEEIKVGDIYKNIAGSCFVICDVNEEDNNAQVLWSSSLSSRKTLDEITRYYTKTGRHIDIDSFLKQIRGEQE